MAGTPRTNLRCPLCGGANACAPARSGSFDAPCWCRDATFGAALLARVPAALRGVSCICATCAAAAVEESGARSAVGVDLQASWRRAWRGIGARSDGDALFAALTAAYLEPQRHYHTLQHLGECLALFERVESLAAHAAEVETALWFHDAVYDVTRSDNEMRSAAWLGDAAGADGVAAEVAQRIGALIMATRHAALPAGSDEQLLVDIDLAILGAGAARFAEYERQIRAEYAFVAEATFKTRRRAVLAAFLARERIFSTARLHDELERPARANLARAIDANG